MPFPCTILDTENVRVANRFTGESCMLTPQAVAVFDTIMGAEMFGLWEVVRKGIAWFREYYPKEYMILLD